VRCWRLIENQVFDTSVIGKVNALNKSIPWDTKEHGAELLMEVESNNRSSLGAGGTTEAAGQAGGVSQESFIELSGGKMVSLCQYSRKAASSPALNI
jgi:hypothetical protein